MKTFFTPGPAQLYPTVRAHINDALNKDVLSMSHRAIEFQNLFAETQNNLRELLKIPKTHQILFISSGTEAMEIVIRNCVGKHSSHLVAGAFGERFYQTSLALKKRPLNIK